MKEIGNSRNIGELMDLRDALREFYGLCPAGKRMAEAYLGEAQEAGLSPFAAFIEAVARAKLHSFCYGMSRDW